MDCLFCRVIKKEIPANFVQETENLVVFPDINPIADVHLLIVPRVHIRGFEELKVENGPLLVEIYQMASKLVTEYNLKETPYHVSVNGGKAQHIPHVHFHFLSGAWKKSL